MAMEWMQDGEIVRWVLTDPKATSRERDLATRLGDSLDQVEELKARLQFWNPHMRERKIDTKYVGDA